MLVNILSFKKTMETELKNISGGAEPTYFEETENLEIYIDGIRWYTYKQLSALLDTSISSIYKKVKAGKIKKQENIWAICLQAVGYGRIRQPPIGIACP